MDKEKNDIFENRLHFKEFCLSNKILTPEFFVAQEMPKLTAWAMKQNSFPLAMKTVKNYTDGKFSFLLRAYREFPEFFESIREEYQGKVIVEKLVEAKARLEVCCLKGNITHISQFALERSVYLRHAWRAFPIKLPSAVFEFVQNQIMTFKELIQNFNEPIVFSFAIASKPILISINKGPKRLEHREAVCERAGIPNFLDGNLSSKSNRFFKVVYRRNIKEESFSEEDLKIACEPTHIYHEILDEDLVVIFAANSLKELQKCHLFNL